MKAIIKMLLNFGVFIAEEWPKSNNWYYCRVLTDPQGTEYPENLRSSNIVWKNNIYPMRDILAKIKSEVPL
jgi:hypothetical protein